MGSWILGLSFNIGCCPITGADLLGAFTVLQMPWDIGMTDVVLELDSQVAVRAILNRNEDVNAHSSIISLIQGLLSRNWVVELCRVYMVSNFWVDWLVRLASNHATRVVYHQSPCGCSSIILGDICGVSFPAFVNYSFVSIFSSPK